MAQASSSDPRVAGLAQAHEVTVVVGATLAQRKDVMYFLGGRQPPVSFTLFAQRVCGEVAGADSFPRPSVPSRCSGVTQVLVVNMLVVLFVFRTVSFVREVGTAGIRARMLWPCGHGCHLLRGKKKRPPWLPAKASS